jgi:hypothetical protein
MIGRKLINAPAMRFESSRWTGFTPASSSCLYRFSCRKKRFTCAWMRFCRPSLSRSIEACATPDRAAGIKGASFWSSSPLNRPILARRGMLEVCRALTSTTNRALSSAVTFRLRAANVGFVRGAAQSLYRLVGWLEQLSRATSWP